MKHRIWPLASPFLQPFPRARKPLLQHYDQTFRCVRQKRTIPASPGLPGLQRASLNTRSDSSQAKSADTASGQPLGQESSHGIPAEQLSQHVTQEEKRDWSAKLAESRDRQVRNPWHRDGVDQKPANVPRKETARTKGKLLTTPSRLLKLILPLTTSGDKNDTEPLALLLHPQQPLSYLERLVQAEVPIMHDKDGHEKIPAVYFLAEDQSEDSLTPKKPQMKDEEYEAMEKADQQEADDQTKLGSVADHHTPTSAAHLRGGPGEGGVESYSGQGQDAPSMDKDAIAAFVRWSKSAEIGDFIRDAARGKEFAIEIEGAPEAIRVGVPSFADRTHYLRMRLRNTSRKIATLADVKKECDEAANRGGQRVAISGFGILCGWWYLVYRLTFETELGWDVMEPVTYLVGLSTLIGGYMWFLYHNREVSYRSALNFTISKRQSKLYEARGFDLKRWEALIEEGNALRREIRAVATEYDVDWDELDEEKAEKVRDALQEGKKKKEKRENRKKDDKDSEED